MGQDANLQQNEAGNKSNNKRIKLNKNQCINDICVKVFKILLKQSLVLAFEITFQ